MIRFGVASPAAAIEAARGRGVPPRKVLEIIAHAEARQLRDPLSGRLVVDPQSKIGRPYEAWGPGAVRRRVINALPDDDVADGWMAASDRWVRERRRIDRQVAGQGQTSECDETAHRIADWEAEHGMELDALSDAQVEALAARLPAFVRGLLHRSGRGAVRTHLLEVLAEAQGCNR